MENPIFKLESVVQERNEEALQDFEGPLDLILSLLSKNKIEIQNIPIALILDQYLAYLEQRKNLNLEVASEFVTMAAHLMYIKSRMLLSLEDEEAKTETEELIRSLEERKQRDKITYMRIKLLTGTMSVMSEFGLNTMTRQPEPMERGAVYEYNQNPEDLVRAMRSISDRAERMAPPDHTAFDKIVKREIYSVADKIHEIVEQLKHYGITRFLLLFRGSASRSEIVATFLAVLELCHARVIRLAGSDVDCTVDYEESASGTLAL